MRYYSSIFPFNNAVSVVENTLDLIHTCVMLTVDNITTQNKEYTFCKIIQENPCNEQVAHLDFKLNLVCKGNVLR